MALDEQELSEDLLWGDGGSGSEVAAGGASSEEEPEQQQHTKPPAPESFQSKKHKPLDIAGVSSASHQSSTLRASLEEELAASGPTPSPPVDVPGGFRRGGGVGGTAAAAAAAAGADGPHQLPHFGKPQQQPYTRLGTSAPIAIPNMGPWRAGADSKGSGRQADAASTFIPPHQLSRQEDFTFSFTGASPSATLKRERLRARNAILRSTGFLEPSRAGQPIPAAAAAAVPAAAEPSMARTPVQSSLTAALTTIGET